jgi:hypothetical protein
VRSLLLLYRRRVLIGSVSLSVHEELAEIFAFSVHHVDLRLADGLPRIMFLDLAISRCLSYLLLLTLRLGISIVVLIP